MWPRGWRNGHLGRGIRRELWLLGKGFGIGGFGWRLVGRELRVEAVGGLEWVGILRGILWRGSLGGKGRDCGEDRWMNLLGLKISPRTSPLWEQLLGKQWTVFLVDNGRCSGDRAEDMPRHFTSVIALEFNCRRDGVKVGTPRSWVSLPHILFPGGPAPALGRS